MNYNYGHSFCRFVVNELTAIAISKMGANPVFSDCGSKYHLLEKMILDKDYKIKAYRPPINAYDAHYVAAHKPSPNVELSTEKWEYSCDLSTKNILACDTIYYPGVMDCIYKHVERDVDNRAYVIFTAYNPKLGVHRYIDNEGTYNIYKKGFSKYVVNRPNGNDMTYEHPLFEWENKFSWSGIHNKMYWKELKSYNIGGEARTVLYEVYSVNKKY